MSGRHRRGGIPPIVLAPILIIGAWLLYEFVLKGILF